MEEEARSKLPNPLATRRCVGCHDTDCDLRQLQCACFWCRDCFGRYLQVKLAERYLWPPKCCHFTLRDQDVEWIQSSAILEEYRKIDREKREPPLLYCSQKQCRAILNTQNTIRGSNIIACDKCKSKTCQKCEQEHEPIESECKGPPKDAKFEALVRHEDNQAGEDLDEAFYEVQDEPGGPSRVISQRDILELAGRVIAQEAQRRRRNRQNDLDTVRRVRKENLHPEQRHDHGPSKPSSELHGQTTAIPGQSQYLPYRQRPEPSIENPLRPLPPNRDHTLIPESTSATLPPRNVAIDSLPIRLSYQGEVPINVRHPGRHRQNRTQSLSSKVRDPSQPDLSPAQQTPEVITMKQSIRQPVAPEPGRGFFAASRGDLHDSLPTEQTTPTELGSRPESEPQDEVPHTPGPSTPPSQLIPSSPPPWYPRSH
ncbi:hypothetical protein F5Y00DRAFT_261102 [Daldinia vernicosa]|uniref:uncharacterized protein n=1 Tax=Daldinia vernicosa TaxID=114800 RepID=UPI002008E91F|nr:uncharacterized protein F5Y00DRAFT_261102 [Daldinia vernicosa]KAI0850000.1 hypothetical protein F5Y00DRAFT_261102 [Daldinia vernicosa]